MKYMYFLYQGTQYLLPIQKKKMRTSVVLTYNLGNFGKDWLNALLLLQKLQKRCRGKYEMHEVSNIQKSSSCFLLKEKLGIQQLLLTTQN